MVNYAVDIENSRIASAMQDLGIAKHELIIKTLEDFADPHITPEIHQLRFSHYTQALKRSINEIREQIKSKSAQSQSIPSNVKALNKKNSSQPVSNTSRTQLDNSKYPLKHRAILRSNLSLFQMQNDEKSRLGKPSSSSQDLISESLIQSVNKKSFSKFKELQKKNLKSIQTAQIRSQVELYKKSEKLMEEHISREKTIEKLKRIKAKERDENFQRKIDEIVNRKAIIEEGMEDDIVNKLERFENKIKKSEEIHSEALRAKVEKAQKFRVVSDSVQKNIEFKNKILELETFQRLVEKHENVKLHRERIEEKIQQSTLSRKEKFDKQHAEALEKIKKNESDFIEKSKSTEKKYLTAQQIVSERKSKIHKNMILRKEMKKLKDLECLNKIQRAKRRFDTKNSKSLQRTLEKYQKIEEFKQEREKTIYQNRDSAIKAMVERERFLEAVAIICKSPRSRTSQEKLKTLNYLSKEVSICREE